MKIHLSFIESLIQKLKENGYKVDEVNIHLYSASNKRSAKEDEEEEEQDEE